MNWCNKDSILNALMVLMFTSKYNFYTFKWRFVTIFSKILKIRRTTGMENDRCLGKRFVIALMTI